MARWSDKPKTEQKADLNRYRAAKKAANNAARKHRDEGVHTKQLNEAVIEAEKEIPWWLR